MVYFRILGSMEAGSGAAVAALGPPKQRALLAILLIHLDEIVPMDHLIDLLWGEEAPKTATASLQNAVGRLRRVLGTDVLVHHAPGYLLKV